MTKIEAFKNAKHAAERIAADVRRALGRDSSSNDKHRACAKFLRLENASFAPMTLIVDASYGYYGNSSGYSATSEELGGYLARAINKHMTTLLDDAVKMAAEDAEKARKEAEAEARAVLQEAAA